MRCIIKLQSHQRAHRLCSRLYTSAQNKTNCTKINKKLETKHGQEKIKRKVWNLFYFLFLFHDILVWRKYSKSSHSLLYYVFLTLSRALILADVSAALYQCVKSYMTFATRIASSMFTSVVNLARQLWAELLITGNTWIHTIIIMMLKVFSQSIHGAQTLATHFTAVLPFWVYSHMFVYLCLIHSLKCTLDTPELWRSVNISLIYPKVKKSKIGPRALVTHIGMSSRMELFHVALKLSIRTRS